MWSRPMARVHTRSLPLSTSENRRAVERRVSNQESHSSSVGGPRLPRVAYILLTLWAGGLWTICGVAAPSAFAVLERRAAGELAARLFEIAAWSGAVIALLLFVLFRAANGLRSSSTRSVSLLIVTAGLAPVLSEVVLGPLMHTARLQGDMRAFGVLHGVGGALFLVACVGTLVLTWKLSPAR